VSLDIQYSIFYIICYPICPSYHVLPSFNQGAGDFFSGSMLEEARRFQANFEASPGQRQGQGQGQGQGQVDWAELQSAISSGSVAAHQQMSHISISDYNNNAYPADGHYGHSHGHRHGEGQGGDDGYSSSPSHMGAGASTGSGAMDDDMDAPLGQRRGKFVGMINGESFHIQLQDSAEGGHS
jgi:hypothetical protein